jgi:hypothetical protein
MNVYVARNATVIEQNVLLCDFAIMFIILRLQRPHRLDIHWPLYLFVIVGQIF